MKYLCLARDLPLYPKVAWVDGGTYITRHDGTIKIVPAFCKHMGYPLIIKDEFTPFCGIHKVTNQLKSNHKIIESSTGYIFEGDSSSMENLLPDVTNFSEFGQVTTMGSFSQQMWLENTMDLEHIAHVHPDSFAPMLDVKRAAYTLYRNGMSSMDVPVFPKAVEGLAKLITLADLTFRHWVVAHNLSVTSFCGVMISVELILDDTVLTRFFAHPSLTDKKFLSLVLQGNEKILKEDADMLSAMDEEAYMRGQLKNSDARIAWYRKNANLKNRDGTKNTQDSSDISRS